MSKKTEDVLVYTGGADVRTITEADWMVAGVRGQKTISWNPTNNYEVPAADLSEDAMEAMMAEHGGDFRQAHRDSSESAAKADTKQASTPAPNGN